MHGYGLDWLSLIPENAGQVVKGFSHRWVLIAPELPPYLQRLTIYGLRLVILAQQLINLANRGLQVRLHYRFVGEVMTDTPGRLVQNLPQHGGIAARSHRRTNTLEHVLEKLGHLPASFGFELGLLAKTDLLPLGPSGANGF